MADEGDAGREVVKVVGGNVTVPPPSLPHSFPLLCLPLTSPITASPLAFCLPSLPSPLLFKDWEEMGWGRRIAFCQQHDSCVHLVVLGPLTAQSTRRFRRCLGLRTRYHCSPHYRPSHTSICPPNI
ncbi:unnamed protein product [Pleuronectes platessa]|uniref:Uncharacterized protein n=1 Tax=Pleuronectes platessa TaxID=8262 RepID=A0A9N7YK95_PLEPL|nr:unnamed protein product [Pleuronectes platessa]